MMNYEEFKQKVMNEFLDYMPEEYSRENTELELRDVPKVNTVLTGIVLKPKQKGNYVSPTFYMERLYAQYEECGSFEKVMKDQCEYLKEAQKYAPKVPDVESSAIKDKVIFQLVNTENNKKMVESCPSRQIHDLTVVYRVIVNLDHEGVSGFLISNDIAEAMGVTEEELFNLAKENTPKLFPAKVERIEETVMRMMRQFGASEEEIDEQFQDYENVPNKERVYVISNEYDFFGANALLLPEVLDKAAEQIGTNCYVIPSSVHDLVVLSAEGFASKERLASLVSETNTEHVKPSDVLSNNIYEYDPVSKELTFHNGKDLTNDTDIDDDPDI